MLGKFYQLARPLLFGLDAETAHHVSIRGLGTGIVGNCGSIRSKRLTTTISGLEFPNPLGLAAGYDKNGEVPEAALRLGFGFVEIGTVTPRPQSGNPKPRIFRLIEQQAIINRLGFNNQGHDAVYGRLAALRQRQGIIGVNIGANKDSEDFVADYVSGLSRFYDVADYFTANISSPNTPGLRNLQNRDALQRLLEKLFDKRAKLATASGITRPVFLKIAPDIDKAEMDDIAAVIAASPLDALIVSNTTLDRKKVASARHGHEAGGLSGKPLFQRSTIVLAAMRERLGKDASIIGVGGIDSADTALQKIEAGANLLQLYSALVYHGPGLVNEIVKGLDHFCAGHGVERISDLSGTKSRQWAEMPL